MWADFGLPFARSDARRSSLPSPSCRSRSGSARTRPSSRWSTRSSFATSESPIRRASSSFTSRTASRATRTRTAPSPSSRIRSTRTSGSVPGLRRRHRSLVRRGRPVGWRRHRTSPCGADFRKLLPGARRRAGAGAGDRARRRPRPRREPGGHARARVLDATVRRQSGHRRSPDPGERSSDGGDRRRAGRRSEGSSPATHSTCSSLSR